MDSSTKPYIKCVIYSNEMASSAWRETPDRGRVDIHHVLGAEWGLSSSRCLKLRKVVGWTTRNYLFHCSHIRRLDPGRLVEEVTTVPPGAVTQAWSLGQLRTPAGNRVRFTLSQAWLSNAPRAFCSGTRVQTDRLSEALCSWEEFSGGSEISEKVKQRALLIRNAFLTPHRWLPELLAAPLGSEGGQTAPRWQHAVLTPVLVHLCKAICVLRH